MGKVQLLPADDVTGCPFLFFEEDRERITDGMYKIYHDGGHYVATRLVRSARKCTAKNTGRDDIDILFDSLYYQALKEDMTDEERFEYIKSGILSLFPDYVGLDEYIQKKIDKKWHNWRVRRKRFYRKAHLNHWNYLVTFTYDDRKQTESSFRRRLRKCLSNFHTRRGWKYIGVFERAPETGRLHFHGVFYIPSGEMVGCIEEKTDYSKAKGMAQVRHENDFFTDSFGRNDFEELNVMELRRGRTLEYLLKYIEKTGERMVYSRGIPTEICREIEGKDIVCEMQDFVTKFVLFDDVIEWERDIMNYKRKQLSIIDLLCNPPRLAV